MTYILLFLKATLGGCLLRQAGHPWGTLLLSGRSPQISLLWGLVGDTAGFDVCGAVLRCGALLRVTFDQFRPRRPLFILGSVMSTMLLSVSVSKSSRVQVFFFEYGELDLGSKSKFRATFASHDVASCSSFSLFSSSRIKFFREGGVIDSIGGIFSLSELKQSGSSKYLGLYSCSIRLGHGSESDMTLLSTFLGVRTLGSFQGTCFPSVDGFFHGEKLFSSLLHVLYQCVISGLCFDLENQKNSVFG